KTKAGKKRDYFFARSCVSVGHIHFQEPSENQQTKTTFAQCPTRKSQTPPEYISNEARRFCFTDSGKIKTDRAIRKKTVFTTRCRRQPFAAAATSYYPYGRRLEAL